MSVAPSMAVPEHESEISVPATTLTEQELYRLGGKRWMELCEAFCAKLGFEVEELQDDELDFLLKERGTEKVLGYAKCFKHWQRQVHTIDLSNLWNVMQERGIGNGIVFSKGIFTREARDYGKSHDFDLLTVPLILESIPQLQPEDIHDIEELVREIRFIAPYCRRCGSLMEHTKNQVGGFWRCSNQPDCNVTLMR